MDKRTATADEKLDKVVEMLDKKTSTDEDDALDRSETHWSQSSGDGLQQRAPQQFSELDQSASSQAAASASMEAVGKLAYQDAITGVDTDRGPVMDAVYNGAVTEGHRTTDTQETYQKQVETKSTASGKL